MRTGLCAFALAIIWTFGLPLLAQDVTQSDVVQPDVEPANPGTLNGMITEKESQKPVTGVIVTLDAEPADGVPEYRFRSDIFGLYRNRLIAPGSYTLKLTHAAYQPFSGSVTIVTEQTLQKNAVLELKAQYKTGHFPIYVRVKCAFSNATLEDAEVKLDWTPLNVGSPVSRKLSTGRDGVILFEGNLDGDYVFSVTREGWEPLTIPTVGKSKLTAGHSLEVALKPAGFGQITVRAQGIDPTGDPYDQDPKLLTGVIIELAALGFVGEPYDDQPDLTPPRIELTKGAFSPEVSFDKILPFKYRIVAKKLGYLPVTKVFTAVNLGIENVEMVINPATKVEVSVNSLYKLTDYVEGADVVLEGLKGTHTEDIHREKEAALKDGKVLAEFGTLLPGRYWLTVKHRAQVYLPLSAITSMQPNSRRVLVPFKPFRTIIEVAEGETRMADVMLDPVPTIVRGRLFIMEKLSENFSGKAEERRVYVTRKVTGIEIIPHGGTEQFTDPSVATYTVDTDDQGHFVARVLPGRYGIKIPGMTGYTGDHVRLASKWPGQPRSYSLPYPWPFSEDWPHFGYHEGRHGTWIHFEGVYDHTLDLYLHKQSVNLWTHIKKSVSGTAIHRPSWNAVLMFAANQFVTAELDELTIASTVTLSGPVNQSPTIEKPKLEVELPQISIAKHHGVIRMPDLIPGTYSLSATHPHFDIPPFSFTIAPWQAPGVLPTTDPVMPLDPTKPRLYQPGYEEQLRGVLSVSYKAPSGDGPRALVFFVCSSWDADEQKYMQTTETKFDTETFFHYHNAPFNNTLYTVSKHEPYVPYGPHTFYYFRTETGSWYKHAGATYAHPGNCFNCNGPTTGCDTDFYKTRRRYYYYIGGPKATPPATIPPMLRTAIDVEVRTYGKRSKLEMVGIKVQIDGKETASGPGKVLSGVGNYEWKAADITINELKWDLKLDTDIRVELVKTDSSGQGDLPKVRVHLYLERQMQIDGTIKGDTELLPGTLVVIRNRLGTELKTARTDDNGAFVAGQIDPQIVFVDVQAPGFYPDRKRFVPKNLITEPDLTGVDFDLNPLPGPDVSAFSFDRYGYFLPGVLKSGNPAGFNPNNATDKLTTTWTVEVAPKQVKVDLIDFDDGTGTPGQLKSITINDKIARVWVVDKRWFYGPSHNWDANLITLPAKHTLRTVQNLLASIRSGTNNSVNYIVAHSIGTETAGKWSGTFKLWQLPIGEFTPWVIVVTERGGVTIADYATFHPSKHKLTGVKIPKWASFMTNIIGTMANLPAVDIKGKVPEGKLIPMPTFLSRIDLSQDNYLTYDYRIDVTWHEGMKNSGGGLMALGSRFFGLTLGAELGFLVKGEDQTVSVIGKAKASADITEQLRKSLGNPAILRAKKKALVQPAMKLSGLLALTVVQKGADGPFPESMRVKAQITAGVDVEVKVDLTPVLSKIPYIGPVLKTAKETGAVEFFAVALFSLGGTMGSEWDFTYPKVKILDDPDYVTPPAPTPPLHMFGGLNEVLDTKLEAIYWKAGLGLEVSVLDGAGTGRGTIQIAAPKDEIVPQGGVKMFVNPVQGEWPLIKRIKGAASITANVRVSLKVFALTKSWQWDIKRFDWQLGTEGYYQLIPTGEKTFLSTPKNAPESSWTNSDGELVSEFYPAGSLSSTTSDGTALVYTQTSQSDGGMPLMVSLYGQNGWSTPVQIATTTGATSLSIVLLPDGTYLAAWAEIDPTSDKTGLKYSISDANGQNWSAPKEIANVDGTVRNLTSTMTDGDVVLAWLQGDEGPLSGKNAVMAALFDGQSWGNVVEVQPKSDVRSIALSGSQGSNAPQATLAVLQKDGSLKLYVHNGNSWGSADTLTTSAGHGVSLAYDDQGTLFVVLSSNDGNIMLYRKTGGEQSFTDLGVVVADAAPGELKLVAFDDNGQTVLLLTWIEGNGEDQLWAAYLNGDGTPKKAAQNLSGELGGSMSKLAIVPLEGSKFPARIIVHTEGDQSSSIREWQVSLDQVVDPEQQPDTLTPEPESDVVDPTDVQPLPDGVDETTQPGPDTKTADTTTPSDVVGDSGGEEKGGGGGCNQSPTTPLGWSALMLLALLWIRRRRHCS